jgi:hypothetical protein
LRRAGYSAGWLEAQERAISNAVADAIAIDDLRDSRRR